MSFHNPGNPVLGQSLSPGTLLADDCVGQIRGQREEEGQMLRKKGRVYVGLGILDFGSGVVGGHLETGTVFFSFLSLKMVSKDRSECQSKFCRLSLDS